LGDGVGLGEDIAEIPEIDWNRGSRTLAGEVGLGGVILVGKQRPVTLPGIAIHVSYYEFDLNSKSKQIIELVPYGNT
jgi:hypothetical protein